MTARLLRRCFTLTPILTLGLAASAVAAPSHLYVSNNAKPGKISEFTIGTGGQLASSGSVSTSGKQTAWGAVTTNGKYLYAPNANEGTVAQFAIQPNGSLTALSPATVSTGSTSSGPQAIAVTPNGKYVYVTDFGSSGTSSGISLFVVGTGGKLRLNPAQAATTSHLNAPAGVAVSPDGRSLYAVNTGNHTVAEFNVAANGTLAPKTVPVVATGGGPTFIVLTPDGRYAYVSDLNSGTISQYKVGTGGQLVPHGPLVSAGPPSTFLNPGLYLPAVSPDGKSLYAPNQGKVYQFTIGSNGLLTPKSPASVGTGGTWPATVALTPDGKNAYVTNYENANPGTIAEYTVGTGGKLTKKPTPSIAAGDGPTGVMIAPDQGPVAKLKIRPAHAGRHTHFNGSASSDSDGRVARYDWAFGDGTTAHTSGPKTSHKYKKPGTYRITLTVTDDSGCSTSLIFTGTTAYCNGTPAARRTEKITIKGKPAATTGQATQITKHSAKLTGKVNPGGLPTKYRFQYGTSKSYGSQTASKSVGSGMSTKAVASGIHGLKPHTTYHYRLVATNSAGKTVGRDRTFTTP